jgi:hypothetical protein
VTEDGLGGVCRLWIKVEGGNSPPGGATGRSSSSQIANPMIYAIACVHQDFIGRVTFDSGNTWMALRVGIDSSSPESSNVEFALVFMARHMSITFRFTVQNLN